MRIKAYDAPGRPGCTRELDSSVRSELFLLRLADAVSNWEGQLREYLFELRCRTLSRRTATAMLEAAPPMHQVNDLPYNFDLPAFQEPHAWVQEAFQDYDVAVPESDRISLGPVFGGGQLLDLPDPTELSSFSPISGSAQVSQVGSLIMEKVTALLRGSGPVQPEGPRILHEVHVHCEKVASWWVPLDMRHFTPSLVLGLRERELAALHFEGQGRRRPRGRIERKGDSERLLEHTGTSRNEDTGDPDRSSTWTRCCWGLGWRHRCGGWPG